MSHVYVHHRIEAAPRQWNAVAGQIVATGTPRVEAAGGALFGVWRSQIGRPRDELTAMSVWPDDGQVHRATGLLLDGVTDCRAQVSVAMVPTLRPAVPDAPKRQGNYAFRWFVTPPAHWEEFLSLCQSAWPGFEAAYDSQVIGLWRCREAADDGGVRSLLLTRRPDLGTWERSKIPQGEAEAVVREKLSRRYDLCDWTCVSTATLITATDREDTARWT